MAIVKISRFQRFCNLYRIMRTFSTSPRVCENHYEVLGVTPKATQGDIKSAYYKLSQVYHPDKSKNEVDTKKFREIKEAYEVLGNIKLKKMYDKGLMVGQENRSRMEYEPDPIPTDPTLRFYRSHAQRHVTPTTDGRTPIYDFDNWSRNHYGTVFHRQQYEKEFIKIKKAKRDETLKSSNQEAMIYTIVALSFLVIFVTANTQDDYDRDLRKHPAETIATISETPEDNARPIQKSPVSSNS